MFVSITLLIACSFHSTYNFVRNGIASSGMIIARSARSQKTTTGKTKKIFAARAIVHFKDATR
ncbi:hypothetical protein D3C72_2477280 [compost metagenome]